MGHMSRRAVLAGGVASVVLTRTARAASPIYLVRTTDRAEGIRRGLAAVGLFPVQSQVSQQMQWLGLNLQGLRLIVCLPEGARLAQKIETDRFRLFYIHEDVCCATSRRSRRWRASPGTEAPSLALV